MRTAVMGRTAVALLLTVCSVAAVARGDDESKEKGAKPVVFNFDGDEVGKLPADFTTARTGGGEAGAWSVVEDKTAPSGTRVLAQTSADDTDDRFPVCVYDKTSARDVAVSVRFKPISGKVDQGAGIVVRYRDRNNYYVTRANALEDNVRLYHVVNGKRKQFAGVNAKVESGKWHSLKLVAKGGHFQVHYDEKLLFEADDETFKDAGKVGLWTKADSVIHFDDLTIEAQNEEGFKKAIAQGKSGDTKPTARRGAFLGIQLAQGSSGAVIGNVIADTAAAKAQLKAGDKIVKVGETAVGSPQELMAALAGHAAGDTISLEVERDGWTKTIQVTLGPRPKEGGGDEGGRGKDDDDGDE